MNENLTMVTEETQPVVEKEDNETLVKESVDNILSDSKKEVCNEENVKVVKGVDIYVENDISNLERMLGVSSSPVEVGSNAQNIEHNVLEELENFDKEDQEDSTNEDVDEFSINEENNKEESDNVEIKESFDDEDVIESDVVIKSDSDMKDDKENKYVLLSDFMDLVEDEFTFLQKDGDTYIIESLSLDDRKRIQRAVKGKDYIFRYPKYTLRDTVLGYKEIENTENKTVSYIVYFPEYSLSFNVALEYRKPYSVSFTDYMNDLVNRVRPDDLYLSYYTDSVTITNLKVVETGLLELETSLGTDKYIQKIKEVSFYKVLDYIRELSDQGNDKLSLKLIPAYFSLL